MSEKTSRSKFSGSIGFILAAAGSAVGLGNIWRFPYLAAKDGGGLFLIVYLLLVLTFGFTLLMTDVAIGRKTRQSPLTAYHALSKKWSFVGILACVVPAIILPYYCVIGGWVVKYLVTYLTFHGASAVQENYFSGFITAQYEPIIFMLIFLLAAAVIVYMGVEKGIEKSSKILMPALFLLIVVIVVFSLTMKHTDADGTTRTALQGLKVYLIPDLKGMTISSFLSVLIDAVGQLFFSLSVAMGIMIAYGSYVQKENDLNKCINQIEIFDTFVAFLAGMMIIPTVYTFMGREGLSASGPSLMFVSLPKVFEAMGPIGDVVGILFFLLVLFAALTSAVSIMEAVVSSLMDKFKMSRKKASIVLTFVTVIIGIIVCLGYNVFYFDITLPNGSHAQILDLFDYISNNWMMPLVALLTSILIGWVLGPKTIIEEVETGGKKMHRKLLYIIMIKYVVPVMLFVLLLKSVGLI